MDRREENPVISELENLENDFEAVIDIGCGDGKMLFQIGTDVTENKRWEYFIVGWIGRRYSDKMKFTHP